MTGTPFARAAAAMAETAGQTMASAGSTSRIASTMMPARMASLCASLYSAPCGLTKSMGAMARSALICATSDARSAAGVIDIDLRPKFSRSGYDGCAPRRTPCSRARRAAYAIESASPVWPPQATFAESIKGQSSSSPGEPSPMSAEMSIMSPASCVLRPVSDRRPARRTQHAGRRTSSPSQRRSFRLRQEPDQRDGDGEEKRGDGANGCETVALHEHADLVWHRGGLECKVVDAEV